MTRPQLLSLPERLDADLDHQGAGVTMAFIDAGFHAHPDLLQPVSRVRAYADVTLDKPKRDDFFLPRPGAWHGTMTAAAAVGNGWMSGGRYRGLASAAHIVLIKAADEDGDITGKNVAKAIRFALQHPELDIRVLSISLGIPRDDPDAADVELAVSQVVAAGITVVAAAGNTPGVAPAAPGSARDAITVGGQNDGGTRDVGDDVPWPSSYGRLVDGTVKPDLLAPACSLPAPMLPGTLVAREAPPLFDLLSVLEEVGAEQTFRQVKEDAGEVQQLRILINALEQRIRYRKYVGVGYQHVDGTSFAAPIVASVVAQMIEASKTKLSPAQVRAILRDTASPLAGVPTAQQGAGVLRPRAAVQAAKLFDPTKSGGHKLNVSTTATKKTNG